MRWFHIVTVATLSAGAEARDQIYKCVDAKGYVEYSNVACKGVMFDPTKGRGSVTNIEMPNADLSPTAKSSIPTLTPEQKAQLDELGIKPVGPQLKSLVIPDNWLK